MSLASRFGPRLSAQDDEDDMRREGVSLGQYIDRLLRETREHPGLAGASQLGLTAVGGGTDYDGAAQAMDRLTARIEAAERRSTLAIAGIDQSVLGMVARLDGAERGQRAAITRMDQTVDALRQTQEALAERLKRMEEQDAPERTITAFKQLEFALEKLAEHVSRQEIAASDRIRGVEDRMGAFTGRLDATLADFATRMDHAVTVVDRRSRNDFRDVTDRLQRIESGMSGAVDQMGDTVKRIADRLTRAEHATNDAIRALEHSFVNLDDRLKAMAPKPGQPTIDDVRSVFERRIDTLAADVARMVADQRAELAREIEKALREGDAGRAIADIQARLGATERRQAETFERAGAEIERIAVALDERVRAMEARNETGAASAIAEIERIALALQRRMDGLESRDSEAAVRLGEEMARLAERLEAKVDQSEKRAADAISQIGDQVVQAAERLQQRQNEGIADLATRIDELDQKTQRTLDDRIGQIQSRMEAAEQRASAAAAPVEKALADVLNRLDSLEDLAKPSFAPRVTPPGGSSFGPTVAAATPAYALGPVTRTVTPEPVSEVTKPAPPPPPLSDDEPRAATAFAPPPAVGPQPDSIATFGPAPIDLDPPGLDEVDPAPLRPTPIPMPMPSAAGPATGPDYLTMARKAARPAGVVEAPKPERKSPKVGLLSAASIAAAVAVVGAGGYLLLKGRQAPDDPPVQPPASSAETPQLAAPPVAPGAHSEGLPGGALTGEGAAQDLVLDAPLPPLDTGIGAAPAPPARATGPASGPPAARAAVSAPASRPTPPGAVAPAAAVRSAPAPRPVTPPRADTPTPAVLDPRPSAAPARAPGAAEATPQTASPQSAPAVAAQAAPQTPAQTAASAAPRAGAPAPPAGRSLPVAPAREVAGARTQALASLSSLQAGPPGSVTLEQAAASGDAVAQFQMGLQRLRDGDALLGANLVRKAAAQGLAAAQYRLAKLHERGEGVPKDLAEARRWTERAAFAGNRKAMHDLAVYYAQGEGVPQSYAAAVEWFRKAAEFGLADSQYNLAVLFAEGQGVTRNQTEALYWFRVAANNGDREAAAKVGDLQRQLKPDEAAAVITRADVFRARAANPRANGEFGPLPWAAATGR